MSDIPAARKIIHAVMRDEIMSAQAKNKLREALEFMRRKPTAKPIGEHKK